MEIKLDATWYLQTGGNVVEIIVDKKSWQSNCTKPVANFYAAACYWSNWSKWCEHIQMSIWWLQYNKPARPWCICASLAAKLALLAKQHGNKLFFWQKFSIFILTGDLAGKPACWYHADLNNFFMYKTQCFFILQIRKKSPFQFPQIFWPTYSQRWPDLC